jgi:hypothetical protein
VKRKIVALVLVMSILFSTFAFTRNVIAADSISVTLNPNNVSIANRFTITLTLPDLSVPGGTQIEILFDGNSQSTMMNIPTTISPVNFTVLRGTTNYPVSNVTLFTYGSAKTVLLRTPSNVTIQQGQQFSIVINENAGFTPLTTGNHTIIVWIGDNRNYTISGSFTVGGTQPSGQSITINSITIANPKPSQTSSYNFTFIPLVSLVPADIIFVEFPSGFIVPQTIVGSNFALKQGSVAYVADFTNNVSVSGNTVKLTIPSGSYTISAGYSYTLIFGAYTGIVNPSATGNYTFKMYTSKQTTPASYTATLGTSITNLFWNASQTAAYAYSLHNISFATSSTGALATSDTITVQFPTGFTLPTLIPQGSVLVNNTIAKASVSSNSLVITCPVSVGNSSQVSIKITTDAKIQNPPSSQTGYKIKVFTSEDPLPFESQAILFTPSIIQNVKVTVSPAVINKSASISVEFVLGMGGALSSSDSIYIVFPMQFTLPSSIANNLVSIIYNNNTYNPSGITITNGTGTVALALPSNLSILAGSSLKVIFDANANITTPAQPNSYKLKVSTSKETTQVDSLAFDIFAYPKSSIVVSPASPDGQNGCYITQPTITFAVGDIMGATITAYYKMGDSDTYKTYDLVNKPSIKIPEGKTTVYFYAQDNFGNKEPENSKTILVDLTDPVITIISPQENSVIVQPTYTLKGSIKAMDVSGTVLTIDGKTVQINSDGSFEALVSVPKEGVYTTIIKVTSPSGRTATKQFSINYIARVTIFLQIGNDKAYINGEQVAIDAPPFISGGNVMVPLRFILTLFKASLDWDNIFQIITLTLGNNRMRLQIGNVRADVNGQLKMLPTVPILKSNITFVPLRFISENFGADVKWDSTLKAVSIVYPKP